MEDVDVVGEGEAEGKGSGRRSKAHWTRERSRWGGRAALLLFLGVFWAPLALGANELRLWSIAPVWFFGFGACAAACLDRLARAPRYRASLWARVAFGAACAWVAWLAVNAQPGGDVFLRAVRLMTFGATLAIAFAAYHVSSRSSVHRDRLLFVLIAIGVLEAGLGVSQGIDAHGTYPNHSHFAGLFEVLIPLTAACAFNRRVRQGWRTAARNVLPLMLVAVGLARSRGGWLALGVALVVFLVVRQFVARGSAIRRYLVGVGLVVGVLLVASVGSDRILARLTSLRLAKVEVGHRARKHLWSVTFRMAREYWMRGVGVGNWRVFYPRFRVPGAWRTPLAAHCDVLQFAAEGGLPGFLLFGLLVGAVGRGLWLQARDGPDSRQRELAAAALGGGVGLLVHGLVDFNLQIPANGVILAVVVALALRDEEPESTSRYPRYRVLGTSVLALFPLTLVAVGAFGAWVVASQLLIATARFAVSDGYPGLAFRRIAIALRLNPRNPDGYRALAELVHSGPGGPLTIERARALVAIQQAALTNAAPTGRAMGALASALELVDRMEGKGGSERAEEVLVQALERFPHDPRLLRILALVRLRLGDRDGALEALRECLHSFDPALSLEAGDDGGYLRAEVQSLLEAGVPPGLMDAAMPEHPEPRIWVLVAVAYDLDRQPGKAVEAWQKAVALGPERLDHQVGLAEALSKAGRPQEAVVAFERAVALTSSWIDRVQRGLFSALLAAERHDEACALAEEGKATGNAVAWGEEYGRCLIHRGDLGGAVEVLEGRKGSKSGSLLYAEAAYRQGRATGARGSLRAALKAYRAAGELAGDAAHAAMIHCYVLLEEVERAEALIEEHPRIPLGAPLLIDLAVLHRRRRDHREALARLAAAKKEIQANGDPEGLSPKIRALMAETTADYLREL